MLIDCQPSLGLLTVNALTAADGVIIPLECEFFALRGVALLMDTISKVTERLNPELELDGILATMYDSRTTHGREVLARVVEAFDDRVFHTVISRTVRFPETTVVGGAHHVLRDEVGRGGRLSAAGPGGAGSMSRRASLPGANELFRTTSSSAALAEASESEVVRRPTRSAERAGQAISTGSVPSGGFNLTLKCRSRSTVAERPRHPAGTRRSVRSRTARREDHRLPVVGRAG